MTRLVRSERGFTLVELLIVITVVGILSSAIISGMNPGKRFREARDSQRKGIVQVVGSGMEVCAVSNGGSYTTPDNCASFAELATKNYVKVNYTGYVIYGAPSGADEYTIANTGCVAAKLEEPIGSNTHWKYTTVSGQAQGATSGC